MNPGFELKEKVAKLEEQLLASHPQMPLLLREIHGILRDDPENVTLLTEEEIGIIVSGLKKHTQTEIIAKVTTSKKSVKKTTLDDL